MRRSCLTIFGDLSANAVQMTCAAFGLATVVATSATAFEWIKWIGVLYLAWIGLRLLLSKPETSEVKEGSAAGPLTLFRQGFITSMANPFAVVFFAALFPQFIDPLSPVWPQLVILGLTYLVVDGAIPLLWAWLGTRAARGLARFGGALVNRVCGGLTMVAAALLATKDFEAAR